MADDCPFCPDGHGDPRRKPWAAWLSGATDRDGQPMYLIVARPDGSHVSEGDARWLRKLIRENRADSDLPGRWDQ
jgi:hypothetical protein